MEELGRYRQPVIAGMEQIGVVKALNGNLATVARADGWELPLPVSYLVRCAAM